MSRIRIQCAARLFSPTNIAPVRSRLSPIYVRHETTKTADRSAQPEPKTDSSDSPGPNSGDSAMISQEDSSQAMVNHQPDYHAPVDHGTS